MPSRRSDSGTGADGTEVTFREYESHDALGLARLVARREVSPHELLDAALARIGARDGALGAIVLDLADEARRAIDRGLPEGPFTGVPFLVKDLGVFTAGQTTTGSCPLFADFVPDHDSTIVERYRAAGLVIFGKTKTPELGVSVTTEPKLYGPTRNPWNPGLSPGGSSGGAAAAVAAGYLPMAHATDGGGSIRIPGSLTGLFGLKPSRGRNPAGPDLGEGLAGMVTSHALTRSVRDSAALLDASAGPAPGDPYAAPPLERPLLDEVGAPPGRLRIALCVTDFEGGAVDPECATAATDAAKLCEELGHHVEEARPDLAGLSLTRAWRLIPAVNLWNLVHARARELGREPRPGDLEPVNWAWMNEAPTHSAADYMATVNMMHAFARRLGAFLARYDLMVTPTLAVPSLKLAAITTDHDDVGRHVTWLFSRIAPHTALFNQTGGAAMTVPLHWTADGLPVGVHFAAGLGDEPKLIRLAAQLEQARPWFDRRPPPPA
jgi:Asp-tRNA(Asn)/Glu-tRNA(Gln) amidotransferase A subunit family amidase